PMNCCLLLLLSNYWFRRNYILPGGLTEELSRQSAAAAVFTAVFLLAVSTAGSRPHVETFELLLVSRDSCAYYRESPNSMEEMT
ncbi:MAG: hypothetical protein JW852_04345, partial [Spirochaetales bacterium]|nr:hypothetical protein [Spirochaetales bacterium]